MNYFEIHGNDGDFYGILVTKLSEEKITELLKEYFKGETYEDMIDDFVDFLILKKHDTEADRFIVTGAIIV